MTHHWKVGLVLALLSVIGVVVGWAYSPVIGVVAFLLAIVSWFVVGTAWMYPRGYEEHDDPPETREAVAGVQKAHAHPKPPSDHGLLL